MGYVLLVAAMSVVFGFLGYKLGYGWGVKNACFVVGCGDFKAGAYILRAMAETQKKQLEEKRNARTRA